VTRLPGLVAQSLAVCLAAAGAAPATAEPPRRTPSQFATGQHGLTFRVPRGTTYCPLPRGWIGSDHGTVIFLERPRDCGGAGYPSSGRGFDPGNVARINVYYSYWMGEDEPPPAPCHQVATVRMLRRMRPVCQSREAGQIVWEVSARYRADLESEAVLRLVTRPERLSLDAPLFRALVASLRTCSEVWRNGRKSFVVGVGPRCPAAAKFF
jgi:hypothetical protein